MKKIQYLILGVLLVFVHSSCRRTGSGQDGEVITVDVSQPALSGDSLQQIFRVSSYLLLQDTIIGDITQILSWRDRYVVRDRIQSAVFLFDSNGKLIRRISDVGQGPREYIHLSGCAVDLSRDELVLYADRPNKLLFFNYDGEFIRAQDIPQEYCFNAGVAVDGKSLYGFRLGNQGESGNSLFRMENGEYRNAYLPYTDWLAPIAYGRSVSVAADNNIWIARPFDNHIYNVDFKEPVRAAYHLDFGKSNLPTGFAEGIDAMKLFEKADSEKVVLHIAKICQVKHYLLFKALASSYFLLDMRTNLVRKIEDVACFEGRSSAHFRGNVPLEYQDQKIAITVPHENLQRAAEGKGGEPNAELDSLLRINSELKNPVLVLYDVAD